MKIKSVKIGAQRFKVETYDVDMANDMRRWGDTSGATNTIRVCHDIPVTAQAETLIHEICHAIAFESGVDGWAGSEVEAFIQRFSPRIAAFFADNPKQVKALVDMFADGA